MKIEFTHYWISEFGWEDTVYLPEDFIKVEELGRNSEGVIFLGINEFGGKHILKGRYL